MQTFRQSPHDPAFVQDPYPFYDRARAAGDFFWWDDYAMACAVSHGAVQAVLRDKRMGRAPLPDAAPETPPHLADFMAVERQSMLAVEPPHHTRLRGQVLRAFTSRAIGALAPQITTLCHDLIDRFPDGPFDLLTAYAQPVPVIVICRLLGVPETHADALLDWSHRMVAMYQARKSRDIEDAANAASRDFTAFLRDIIAAKRNTGGDDLITTLLQGGDSKTLLDEDELIGTCILLLNAGHEATVHTLGNGVHTLLQTGHRTITAPLVEEILRFDPPLHMFTRWVYEDLTLLGHDFRRGDQIACLLAAGNRDPAAYPDPARFDPARSGPANTSFGAGIHFCVGAPLARMELDIALSVLFDRCPDLRLAASPRYSDTYHFHGFDRLMVSKS